MLLKQDLYIFAFETEYLAEEIICSAIDDSKVVGDLIEQGYLVYNIKRYIAFHFVGVIVLKEKIICVLPKYYINSGMSVNELLTDFTQIIKVLTRAAVNNVSVPDSSNFASGDDGNVAKLVQANNLLRDFLENGIFKKNTVIFNTSLEGQTDWNETVNYFYPIITKSGPIYDTLYTQQISDQEYSIITELHKRIVNYLLKHYGRILGYEFVLVEDSAQNISELGSTHFLKAVLLNELDLTYTDREITLLRQLLHFVEEFEVSHDKAFDLYGTGYFHVLWEKTCGYVLNNSINSYLPLIPSPQWRSLSGESIEKDSLRPDIIAHNESVFFIFDAKYYNISYSVAPYSIEGNPGVSDVSKQFLYEIIFKDVNFARKYNCFLFPRIQRTSFQVFGLVKFEPFPGLYIYNVFLAPTFIFDAYLNNKSVDSSLLTQLASNLDSVRS